MATTLVVRFPWGRYHATPWGRHVNEAAVEWPPSPWRVLRALYATWKARAPHLDEARVLPILESLSAAPTYILPAFVESHTRHYMPDVTHMLGQPKWLKNNDYSNSAKDVAFDAFAVFERGGQIALTWPVDLDEERRAVLAELAELMPYLGRAESICDARLLDPAEPLPAGDRCTPVAPEESYPTGTTRVLTPEVPLDVKHLTARTTDVRGKRLVVPPGTGWVEYQRPEPEQPLPSAQRRPAAAPTAFRYSIASSARPSAKAALAMTDVLRQAVMSMYGRLTDGGVSPVLAGKDVQGSPLAGHGHAHYLAFDADGDRLLDHLVVWAPEGFGPIEVQALGEVRKLSGYGHVRDFRPCRLGLEAFGEATEVVRELAEPAKVWLSSTPFAPARHGKRRTSWEDHVTGQVVAELDWRGLPAPSRVEIVRGDWLSYRRHRPTKERLEDARRAIGVRIEFTDPIAGPIALGSLSHFGLGLFCPQP